MAPESWVRPLYLLAPNISMDFDIQKTEKLLSLQCSMVKQKQCVALLK